jgi:hypothetical protein
LNTLQLEDSIFKEIDKIRASDIIIMMLLFFRIIKIIIGIIFMFVGAIGMLIPPFIIPFPFFVIFFGGVFILRTDKKIAPYLNNIKISKFNMKNFINVTLISLFITFAGFFVYYNYYQNVKFVDDVNEEIENENNVVLAEKENLVKVFSPAIYESVSNPLIITGEAIGPWFFEASFPILVVDWNGLIIGEGFATAQDEWMTTEFVPFTASVEFDVSKISGNYSDKGWIILQKDNPSGLPEFDDALEFEIKFADF